jgi:hypothetical protein
MNNETLPAAKFAGFGNTINLKNATTRQSEGKSRKRWSKPAKME